MRRPAKKSVDDKLFEGMPPALRGLQKQSRKELRLKARAEYKAKYLQQSQ